MQIIANNSVVFNYGEAIESGRWENDPSIDTYRITKNGNYEYCVIADFVVYDVETIPEDYESNKYLYENGEFALNPDWKDPNAESDKSIAYDIVTGVTE